KSAWQNRGPSPANRRVATRRRFMPHRSFAIAWVIAWICSSPAAAAAQLETATIVGIVRDQSGAVVPRAAVTITNVQTAISVRTETDAEGAYVVPSLRPGEYTVSAESKGFPRIVRSGVVLQVAQVARVDVT